MSYYEINVAVHGQHLFATATRSAQDKLKAQQLFNLFRNKFPESDGYYVSCVYWESSGHEISFTEDSHIVSKY